MGTIGNTCMMAKYVVTMVGGILTDNKQNQVSKRYWTVKVKVRLPVFLMNFLSWNPQSVQTVNLSTLWFWAA